MIDPPQVRWPHHWLLLILAINLAIAATLAALLALGGRSTELKIVIVLASASVIGFVGLALPVAWQWLYQHSGGPSWFIVPMAVLVMAGVSGLVINLGEAWLGLLPLADLWRVTWPRLAMAAVATLGLGVGIARAEARGALPEG